MDAFADFIGELKRRLDEAKTYKDAVESLHDLVDEFDEKLRKLRRQRRRDKLDDEIPF